jgi:hypothetical protein
MLHAQRTPEGLELVHEEVFRQIVPSLLLEGKERSRDFLARVGECADSAPAATLDARPRGTEPLLESLRVVKELDAVVTFIAAIPLRAGQGLRVGIEMVLALICAVRKCSRRASPIP